MAPPGKSRMPADETAHLVMGLSANYTPTAGQPGCFDWLYDDRGAWREDVWQRWITLDPLSVVKRHTDAFVQSYPVYLDGAEFDEFGANIGARKIHDVLKARSQTVSFYQSQGHHSGAPSRTTRARPALGARWLASS
jgi:hypothetical protein